MYNTVMKADARYRIEQPTLCVTGTGKTHAEPDRFSIRFTIGLEHPDEDFIFHKVSETAEELIKALKGWSEKDDSIRTESFSNYHYEYSDKSGKWQKGQMITVVSTTIRVDSARVKEISALITLAKKSGATTVSSVEFRLSDTLKRQQREIALRQAVRSAQFDASVAANEIGLLVSRPLNLTIREEDRYPAYSRSDICASSVIASDEPQDFIEAGEIVTSVTVDVIYSIAQSFNRTIP